MRRALHSKWLIVVTFVLAALAGCSRDPAAKEARYLERGQELMAKGDFAHAVIEFTNAVKVMPRDAEAHYRLGLAFLGVNRAQQAARSFQAATQLNPKHADAQIKLAELLIQGRNDKFLQDAEERMTAVLAETPDNPDAARALAIAEFKLGKGEEAERKLAATLERFPTNLKAAASMASMKLARRDFAGAEATLRKIARDLPRSVDAGLALAQLYLVTGKQAEAEAEAARILSIDASSAPALLMKGAFELGRGQLEQAERTYRTIAALPHGTYNYAHAVFLIYQKRYDEAIAELRALAAAAPSDRTARTRLVQAELAAGKVEDAERDLDAALKKNPKEQEALLQRGRVLLSRGRLEAAEKDLRAVLALSPNSADAHFAMARFYAASDNDLRAREELGEALRLNPRLLPVRIELARALLSARAAQSALETLDAAPEDQKTGSEFVAARNWALLGLGRAADARTAVDAALRRRNTPELLFQRGVIHFSGKNFAAAKSDADAVLAADPSHVRALHLAVEARVALRENAQAEGAVRAAAARLPQSVPVQMAAGDAFLALGKRADARRCYDAALALAVSYAPAAVAIARLDAAEGRTDSARDRLRKVVEAQPRAGAALMTLADLEYAAGERTQAADLYRRAADIDRRNIVALNNYAYLLAEKNPDAALPLAQKALEAAPDSAMVLDTLGWIYYRKGIIDLAVANLQRAMSREPTPRRQFHLGMAQMKAGQKQSGAENLGAALKKDPKLSSSEAAW